MALTFVALAVASLGSLDLIAVPAKTPFSSEEGSAEIFVWTTENSDRRLLQKMGNQCYLTATSASENKMLGTTVQSSCLPDRLTGHVPNQTLANPSSKS